MQEIPQDAEDQIDAAAQAVALGVAQLLADVMGGKKRISVVSTPFVVEVDEYSNDTGYRHTIEVEDLAPVVMDCATGQPLTDG